LLWFSSGTGVAILFCNFVLFCLLVSIKYNNNDNNLFTST
jgi:hypothetical protein